MTHMTTKVKFCKCLLTLPTPCWPNATFALYNKTTFSSSAFSTTVRIRPGLIVWCRPSGGKWFSVNVTPEHATKALTQCRGTAPFSLLTSTHVEIHATLNSWLSKSLIRKPHSSPSVYRDASDPGRKTVSRCFVKVSYSRPWKIIIFWEVTTGMRYF